MSIVHWIRRRLPWLEPWYDWRAANVFRLDAAERDFSDESETDVWRFELQWLGAHVAIEIGRMPPRVPAAVVASRKLEGRREV